jgi:hypothetical protein
MTTSPNLVDALVASGPHLVEKGHAAQEIHYNESPMWALRHAAAVQDAAFFSNRPPMLLHDDYHVSANKLYGGTEASKITDAAYRPGPFNEVKDHQRLYHGGAMFDINGRVCPVLIYTTKFDEDEDAAASFRGGKTALIAHIYDAPLAELEADLFDDRKPISNLERAWLNEQQASAARNARMHMGAVLRSGGMNLMPGFLINGDYHLVRGALPWLHFRQPCSDHEAAVLSDAITAAMMFDPQHAHEETPPAARGFSLTEKPNGDVDDFVMLTVFDRCKQRYAWVPEKVTTETAESTPSWKPFLERMEAVRGLLSGSSDCRDVLLGLAMNMLYTHPRPFPGTPQEDGNGDGDGATSLELALDYPEFEREEASDMAKTTPPRTLHTLTAMVRTSGIVSPTRIGMATMAPNSLEKVAAATFAASDAVLAFRDVDGWVHKSRDESRHDAVEWCVRMAQRIQEPEAMLVIDLDYVYGIKSARLVNSAITIAPTSFDEMARLIACPWVTVVLHRTGHDSEQGWFTLDTSVVQRKLLTVTDKVRETFGAAPAKPPKPAATPESVEQLRKDMTDRLDKMDKTIADVKTARQQPAPRPPAPLAPPESHVVLSLRASALALERLTGQKRPAPNGGR